MVKTDDIAEGETGTTAPAMVLQMHYASLEDIQFSAYQAFYVVPEAGLVAGTYNVKMGLDWGTNVKNGTTYQFTLTKNAPAGARLTGFYNAPDVRPQTGRSTSTKTRTRANGWRPATSLPVKLVPIWARSSQNQTAT